MGLRNIRKCLLGISVSALCVPGVVATTHAALLTAGPTTPFVLSTLPTPLVAPPVLYPAWYADNLGLQLGLCQDYNGFCKLTPPFCPSPDPLVPLSTPAGCANTAIDNVLAFAGGVPVAVAPANFPAETFYFDATTTMKIGATLAVPFTQSISLVGSFTGAPPTVAPPTILPPAGSIPPCCNAGTKNRTRASRRRRWKDCACSTAVRATTR